MAPAALRKPIPTDRPLATRPLSNDTCRICPVAKPPVTGRTASVVPLEAHTPHARPPVSMPPLPPAFPVEVPVKNPPVPLALNCQAPKPVPPFMPLVQLLAYSALEAASAAVTVPGITTGAVPIVVAMPAAPKPSGAAPADQKPS